MPLSPEFRELATKVNNWGRWGTEDEIGTLNLITPEVVANAAASVRGGKRFSLALPLWMDGPQTGAIPGRANPVRTMTAVNRPMTRDADGPAFSDDVVFMGLQAATHWDALSHVTYEGRLYNGFPVSSIDERGAGRLGIDKVRTLVSRGVLLDMARARGLARLEPGTPITPADLDAAEDAAGVHVGAGDVVLVRTGHMQLLKERKKLEYGAPSPGIEMTAAAWFRDRDVAAVATDTLTFEVFRGPEDYLLPVHMLHLVEMGLTQGQNFDLEELAADCDEDGAYAFFLDATPLPFVRAVGSPVVPVAIK